MESSNSKSEVEGNADCLEDESNLPPELIKWLDLLESIPFREREKDENLRKKLWPSASKGKANALYENTNEMVLKNFKIPEIAQQKEIIKKAYDMTMKQLGNSAEGFPQDQFRNFFLYLRQFLEYWVMFEFADENGDREISFEEFKNAIPTIIHWGGKVDNPEECFKAIDINGDQALSYEEFCIYAIENCLKIQG